jgi:hypothetical protein
MDRIEMYRDVVKHVIRSTANFLPEEEGVRCEMILDDANGHYELISIGWTDQHRIHSTLVHIDIREGKVWVERDGTDLEIVQDLLDGGIQASDMVIGFHPPGQRKYTEFAVA